LTVKDKIREEGKDGEEEEKTRDKVEVPTKVQETVLKGKDERVKEGCGEDAYEKDDGSNEV